MIILGLMNCWGNDHEYEEAKKCNQRCINAAISHGLGADGENLSQAQRLIQHKFSMSCVEHIFISL